MIVSGVVFDPAAAVESGGAKGWARGFGCIVVIEFRRSGGGFGSRFGETSSNRITGKGLVGLARFDITLSQTVGGLFESTSREGFLLQVCK